MKIAIIGTGAIGTLLAEAFINKGREDVLCVVGSEEHAKKIKNEGLKLREVDNLGGREKRSKNIDVEMDTKDREPVDMVFVTVKSKMTEAAILQHKSLFDDMTIVVTLQNGYGNHKIIEKILSKGQIVLGTTALAAYVDEDGTVVHAGNGITVVGPALACSETGGQAVKKVAETLKRAGFQVEITRDAIDAIIRKLFINIGINAICALNGVNNGEIIENPILWEKSKELVREACEVVEIALDRKYDTASIIESVEKVVRKTAANNCSMLQDVRKGKGTEIDFINGAIVRLASERGISAPLNREIVDEIHERFGY